MRRIIVSLLLVILLISTVSAEIIIKEQPKEIYNLGDLISIPTTVKAISDISESLQMDLICEGHQVNFYKNGLLLSAGEERTFQASAILDKSVIGELQGECKIKAILNEDYVLTKDFKISNYLTIEETSEQREFIPEEGLTLKGSVIKENGKEVNGFIDAEVVLVGKNSTSNLFQSGTVNNGFFSMTISLPSDIAAGPYLVKLTAYEKNSAGDKTNNGFLNYNVAINQVPTNLELILEDEEIEPGTNLILKAILHDQTGESIDSTAVVTIKDNQKIVREQTEILTGENFEYAIKKSELPTEWEISAESNSLTAEMPFTILEKAELDIQIINKTVIITNIGNVFYNKTASVKIGEEPLSIFVELDLNESQKYVLTAPEGEYEVEIQTQEGNSVNENVALTGKTIEIKEASGEFLNALKSPFAWIFIIVILGLVAWMIFRKVRKKPFAGREGKSKKKEKGFNPKKEESLITAPNKAELSLSIKGDKQDASIICLHLKNLEELVKQHNSKKGKGQEGSAKEILQNIINEAEKHKVSVYRAQNNVFFILAPVKTKTYKNEKTGLQLSQSIKQSLIDYNKKAKQKIDFGISLNYGPIIAKQDGAALKFMSLGTLVTAAKKIASISKGEILLSEKINDKLRTSIKSEKHMHDKVPFYTISKVKKEDEENKKFIRNFLKKMEKKD